MASLKDLIVNGIGRFVGKVYSAGGFVGNLEGTATKATQDGSGNTITSTYQKNITLNGTSQSGKSPNFYAPTASGTSGQVLKSGGANTSPTWSNADFTAQQVTDLKTLLGLGIKAY